MTSSRRRLLGSYGLSIVLGAMFLLSWVGQFLAQLDEVVTEAAADGRAFSWGDFWPAFGAATLENWQSEFLQLFSFVVLATYFIHKGSPQSRDGDDELRDQITRVEDRLDAVHFQLFEERTDRSPAETHFDERRQDPEYDQKYRLAWRSLQETIADEDA